MSEDPIEAPVSEKEVPAQDMTPRVLAYAVTSGFFAVLFTLMFVEVAPDTKEVLFVMLGLLGTGWMNVISYFFGSTASSRAKDTTISQMSKR